MNKVIIVYEEEVEELYKGIRNQLVAIWKERQLDVEEMCICAGSSSNEYNTKIQATDVKYICTFDMAGFQLGTLLEQPAYNISVAKQLHIVLREEYFGLYAGGDFALNLFFFVPGDVKHWKEKYPNVIHFFGYEKFILNNRNETHSMRNEKILREIVEEFLREVEV